MKLQANIPIYLSDGAGKPPVCNSRDVIAEYDLKQHAAGFMQFSSRERRKNLGAGRSETPGRDPLHLYKYRALDAKDVKSIDKARAILVNDRIWAAAPSSLNDPNDMRFNLVLNEDHRVRRQWVKNNAELLAESNPAKKLQKRRQLERQKITPKMEASFKQDLDRNTGLFCASTTPRETLMWTHYAADHTGICIQYAPYEDELFLIAKEVFYSNNFPTLIVPSPPGKPQEFYLQKATRWEYEKEWRIVLPLNNCSVVLRPAAIAGVIFGAKVKQETIDIVTMLLEERKELNKANISLYQAHLSKSSYDIGIFKHGRTPPEKWESR